MKNLLIGILVLTLYTPVVAADTVRVCAYNILKFSQDNEDGRIPHFAKILDLIRPDVLICEEVADNTAGPRFVSDVLTWAPYAASPYYDGPDTDHMVVYNQEKFDLVGTRRIPTELRDIFEVTLAHRTSLPTYADTLVVYAVHLKASDNTSDLQQREREMTKLVNSVTTKPFAIVCGDFNVYSPGEPALQLLLGPSAKRSFVDPLGTQWQRNSASYAPYYTQCTRATMMSGCGGGVDGGVDDRFDFILPTAELAPRVIKSTYTHVGNDGVARLNQGIDDPVNTKYPADLVAALKCASDHMPIYVNMVLGEIPASVDDANETHIDVRFVNDDLVLAPSPRATTVADILGNVLYAAGPSTSAQTLGNLPSGTYAVQQGNYVRLLQHVR